MGKNIKPAEDDVSINTRKIKRSDSRKSIVLVKEVDYLERKMEVKDYCRINYSKKLAIGKNVGKKMK